MARTSRRKLSKAALDPNRSPELEALIIGNRIPPDCLSFNLYFDPFVGMAGHSDPPEVQECAEAIQEEWRATRDRFHAWATGRGLTGDERDRLERRLWAAQPARTDGTDAAEQLRRMDV